MKDARSSVEDQLLVMDAQDGDAKAMEKLVSRWQKRLWQHAFQMTADNQAAWDITQQAWLGIVKGLRKLNDPASFRAWVYRITTNKSIDWIKRRKRNKEISIQEVQYLPHKEKQGTDIKELLQRLDMKKRTVLSLYYFEELSISEISIALKVPTGTVKSRLHKAREELKKLWQEYFA